MSKEKIKMNFKIENNYLNITNYPAMELHFENMAKKGWLIDKIILGSLFLYKKIEEEELDFSITPYIIETAFERKSKKELEEFNSVCKFAGWNYATKSFDLQVYFKEKNSDATPIHTDEEEEFKTLELIGKKQLRSLYIQIPFLLLFSWFILGGIVNNVYSMKDGFAQIIAPLVPLGIIITIWAIFDMRKFIKRNRKNMEIGDSIEYSRSNFLIPKLIFPIGLLNFLIIIIYFLYAGIFLKNKIMLITFIPLFIGTMIGTAYRVIIKPSRKSKRYKKIGFVVTIISAVVISSWIGVINIENISKKEKNYDIEEYKVLSISDFPDEKLKREGDLLKQSSLLIPKSYEYHFVNKEDDLVVTEYSRALTDSLAKDLVRRYKRQAKNVLEARNIREIELYFKEDIFDNHLRGAGLKEEDLNKFKDKNIKEAKKNVKKIIFEKSISKDNENLWNLDEVYFLNYNNTEIVLRIDKEVFFLEGKDFSNKETINIVKEKLGLN